jgi:iron complex transport system substrate-binding protein
MHRLAFVALLIAVASCGNRSDISGLSGERDTTIRYAKRFSIVRAENYTVVYLFGKRDLADTSGIFVLCSPGNVPAKVSGRAMLITVPCRKIASLSSIYTGMIAETGALSQVAAIDNIDYINNRDVIVRHERGALAELARTPEVDAEKTIAIKPDVVFSFGMGVGLSPSEQRIASAGVPVAVCLDHLESTPLARAEWIRFFAEFTGKRRQADSIFAAVEKNYTELRELARSDTARPSAFAEIRYGDTWYMPAGGSYLGTLLSDAGANYLWSHVPGPGSVPLTFEQVYSRASGAAYWVHLSTFRKKEDVAKQDPRYTAFAAFRSGNLFNNTRVTNRFGYSPYWETGIAHPERILHDLAWIFHPSLRHRLQNDLYYYEQLK